MAARHRPVVEEVGTAGLFQPIFGSGGVVPETADAMIEVARLENVNLHLPQEDRNKKSGGRKFMYRLDPCGAGASRRRGALVVANDGEEMKMIWLGLAVSLLVSPVILAQEMTLVNNGQSPFVIVIAEKPMPANERAAHELQNYIKEISGAELAIQDDAKSPGEHAILVGPSRQLDALGVKLDKDKLGNDGFVIRTVGGHLVLTGPGPRGSMYAASELLEKLGVRWFTPTVTRVPKKTTIAIPAMDETEIPAFEYREPNFYEAGDKDWAARIV